MNEASPGVTLLYGAALQFVSLQSGSFLTTSRLILARTTGGLS